MTDRRTERIVASWPTRLNALRNAEKSKSTSNTVVVVVVVVVVVAFVQNAPRMRWRPGPPCRRAREAYSALPDFKA